MYNYLFMQIIYIYSSKIFIFNKYIIKINKIYINYASYVYQNVILNIIELLDYYIYFVISKILI